ncbi:uncharacterized protein LOC120140518 [Hibiscus syriacus]|uniref:uncharacterized protein LOC120140518 n=1 Tax=Hibiscus syriacus TaxID=106335 RepID=UPI00192249E5|nr:uncharacterized protein LOC120140518 [Hibiscus syriacus]
MSNSASAIFRTYNPAADQKDFMGAGIAIKGRHKEDLKKRSKTINSMITDARGFQLTKRTMLFGLRSDRLVREIDDSLIFGEANAQVALRTKEILREYGWYSGQVINFDKSGVFFSSNVIDTNRNDVQRILKVFSSSNPEKYLRLPAIVGRNKRGAFGYLLDKFHNHISSWSVRALSQGGKKVFIKSVLQAIPLFAMTCFLLPRSLCLEIERIMEKFWWQKSETNRAFIGARGKPFVSIRRMGVSNSGIWGSLTLLYLQSRGGIY